MTDVICVGILVADIFSSPIDSLPGAGELKLMDRYVMSAGGCAANTAADLERLGRKTKVLGKVGNDLLGDFVIRELERLGVDSSHVSRSRRHPTSCTFIANVRGEDRRYIHCIGANADFTLADVDLSVLDGARVLYVGGYLAFPAFGPRDLTELFQQAKRRNLITALDVVVPAGSTDCRAQIVEALPFTDVFLPNNDEAAALTGKKDPQDQAEALARLNAGCTIVITQGPRGALVACKNQLIRAGSFKFDSIDGSGAGDAFSAGFLIGLLEDWPLDYTLRFASAVGASCTRAIGCTDGVFRFDEAQAFVAAHPLEITEIRRS